MGKYTILYDTQIQGQDYEQGEEIDLDEKQAGDFLGYLLGSKTITPIDPEPKEDAKGD
ncbi:hypothetical protein [Helicobacter salomonis]|uniref:hypothetical protein n=1 Tax=Helicobacter salomonis TaxID=56878 RepID=UPI0013151ABF|nr:hypothetical protein [Helicobacter salomonis]